MTCINRFDEKYEIRFARYDEIDKVMQFINDYWREGHILAANRKFFEYEMVVDGQVNFMLAIDRRTGKIEGLHGYLPASKNREKFDAWNSIWKVIPGTLPLLGLEIASRKEEQLRSRLH